MKKIAVLITYITDVICLEYLKGVSDYFQDKDVKLLITQTRLPEFEQGIFEYQYFSNFEFAKAKDIDCYIVLSSLYCAPRPQKMIEEFLSTLAPRPIVSSGIKLNIENTYTNLLDCKNAYSNVVKHMIEKHSCKKFAFMGAHETNSNEAIERFEAFCYALKENNIEFNPDLVFEGGFVDNLAKKDLLNHYKSKDEIDFDVLFCANDLMAIGCISALKSLDVKVPDDVLVFGYDDSIYSIANEPTVSTFNQDFYNQGWKAAEQAYRLCSGKKVELITYSELKPIFRQSCSCLGYNAKKNEYMDLDGNILVTKNERMDILHQVQNNIFNEITYGTLIDLIQVSGTLRQYFWNLKYVSQNVFCSEFAICFFKNPEYIDKGNYINLPGKMELYMFYNRFDDEDHFKPGIVYNPKEKVFCFDDFDSGPGIYILQPIFSGEAMYGYIVCKTVSNDFSNMNNRLKLFVSGLSAAYEYTEKLTEAEKLGNENNLLKKNNKSLDKISKTDELTGILNRRGLIELGQRTIDIIQEMGADGLLFFFDLDGLKKINDNYGHENGDLAISCVANVLKTCFRKSDIVGRLSGDEFCVIATGMQLSHIAEIRNKVDKLCQKSVISENLPFNLSVSLGAVKIGKAETLSNLLKAADAEMYKEKKIRHGLADGTRITT